MSADICRGGDRLFVEGIWELRFFVTNKDTIHRIANESRKKNGKVTTWSHKILNLFWFSKLQIVIFSFRMGGGGALKITRFKTLYLIGLIIMVGERQTAMVTSSCLVGADLSRSCPRGCQSSESKSSEQIRGVSVTSKQPQRMSIISLTEQPLFLSSSLSFVSTCTHRLHLYWSLWERGFPVLYVCLFFLRSVLSVV